MENVEKTPEGNIKVSEVKETILTKEHIDSRLAILDTEHKELNSRIEVVNQEIEKLNGYLNTLK